MSSLACTVLYQNRCVACCELHEFLIGNYSGRDALPLFVVTASAFDPGAVFFLPDLDPSPAERGIKLPGTAQSRLAETPSLPSTPSPARA